MGTRYFFVPKNDEQNDLAPKNGISGLVQPAYQRADRLVHQSVKSDGPFLDHPFSCVQRRSLEIHHHPLTPSDDAPRNTPKTTRACERIPNQHRRPRPPPTTKIDGNPLWTVFEAPATLRRRPESTRRSRSPFRPCAPQNRDYRPEMVVGAACWPPAEARHGSMAPKQALPHPYSAYD